MSTQEPSTDGIDINALLAQQAWLRRLASSLVGDPSTAEDLAQTTWLSLLNSPPRVAGAARTWLRRVFLSRLWDSTRTAARRRAREQSAATAEEMAAHAETPEELAARIELHRRVVGHMAALDERFRVVLFLRFVEDLEPIEVARRLEIPDGTVRWRLKRGIEELRARLDADAGGNRERWLPLVLPFATGANTDTSVVLSLRKRPVVGQLLDRLWTSWTTRITVFGVFLCFGISAACWRCNERASTSAKKTPRLLYQSGALDRAATQVAKQLRLPSAAAQSVLEPAPATITGCPDAQALEKERDMLAATVGSLKTPREHFLEAPPNPGIEQHFGPDVDEMLAREGKCGHALECHGVACRITLVAPESLFDEKLPGIEPCFDRGLNDALKARSVGQQIESLGTVFDLLSRTWLRRFDLYILLANEAGDLVAPEQREPPTLPPAWNRDRGSIPTDLTPACSAVVTRLRKEIETLVRRITRALPMRLAFEQGLANGTLARELAERLQPSLTSDGKPLPIEIECRGPICALRPRDSAAESRVQWDCPKDTKPTRMCFGSPAGDWWFSRLMRKRDELSYLETIEPPIKRDTKEWPTFVRVRPVEEQSGISGKKWVFELVRKHDYAGIVAKCENRYPSAGGLSVSVRVPDSCGTDGHASDPRITVEYGGELLGSELWACLKTETERALQRDQPPACTYRWAAEWRLTFPHPKIDPPELRD